MSELGLSNLADILNDINQRKERFKPVTLEDHEWEEINHHLLAMWDTANDLLAWAIGKPISMDDCLAWFVLQGLTPYKFDYREPTND